jgi:hypothetical protein
LLEVEANVHRPHADILEQTAYHIAAYISQSYLVDNPERHRYYPRKHRSFPQKLLDVQRALCNASGELLTGSGIDRQIPHTHFDSLQELMLVPAEGAERDEPAHRVMTLAEFSGARVSGSALDHALKPVDAFLTGDLSVDSKLLKRFLLLRERLEALLPNTEAMVKRVAWWSRNEISVSPTQQEAQSNAV